MKIGENDCQGVVQSEGPKSAVSCTPKRSLNGWDQPNKKYCKVDIRRQFS